MSISAEPTSLYPLVDPDDRVLTFAEWCEVNRFSQSTGRRILAGPDRPTVTHLSTRRIGIRVGHNRQWQDARTA